MNRQVPHFQLDGEVITGESAPVTETVIAIVRAPEYSALLTAAPELLEVAGGVLWLLNNIEAIDFDPAQFRRYFEAIGEDAKVAYKKAGYGD